MDFMMLATELNAIGKLIYNSLYGWVQTWGSGSDLIGAFGVTVIMFTLFLKIITSPLDIWQKVLMRKNAKKMELMKPDLDRIKKQCGDNQQLLMQKQREVYKKYKYSMVGSCLPMLVTMVLFFVIFSGFNSAVRYHNSVVFDELTVVYDTTYDQTYNAQKAAGKTEAEAIELATAAADAKVVEVYRNEKQEKFLLTQNIFVADNWKSPIPSIADYTGTGMGKMNITNVDASTYERVMGPIMDEFNVNDKGKKQWNGYLILPILCLVVSFLSAKLIKPPEQPPMAGQTEEQIKAQKSQQKFMGLLMPVIMGVFAVFYSTAFTLYMFLSNLITTLFNLTFNLVTKQIDKKERDQRLATTIKK